MIYKSGHTYIDTYGERQTERQTERRTGREIKIKKNNVKIADGYSTKSIALRDKLETSAAAMQRC